jgi:hypothetical protein
MTVTKKMAVLWFVAPCRSVKFYERFEVSTASVIRAMNMEAVQTSETLINLYQSARSYNPETNVYFERPAPFFQFQIYYRLKGLNPILLLGIGGGGGLTAQTVA